MNPQRIDRRRFLIGTGGAVLALPMLEAFAPRMARGATAAPPKRLLIVTHSNGRMVGASRQWDWWAPATTTGPIPDAMSPLLKGLAPIKNEIVTIDGVDNVLRHVINGDGHMSSASTMLTSQVTLPSDVNAPSGPSLDYIAGMALRPDASMRPSVVMPISATPESVNYVNALTAGAGGTDPTYLSGNPDQSVGDLFASFTPQGTAPPPTPTLRDRLAANRGSILDGVASSITALRARLGSADRDRLDQHTTFIRSVETRLTTKSTASVATASCALPDVTQIPHVPTSTWDEYVANGSNPDPNFIRDRGDPVTSSYQLENMVMALACDVQRVGVIGLQDDPIWGDEFTGASPFAESNSLHANFVHATQEMAAADEITRANQVCQGFQHWTAQFTSLIQRLAAVQDVDGSRLLDNTLVVWVSELGYGANHLCYNVPIVMAGLKSQFAQGQGRHLTHESAPRTMGDLSAQILRMLGASTSMTFGETGTLGSVASAHGLGVVSSELGRPGFISSATQLHNGALDL